MEIKDLKSKSWYRLLKLLFILSYVGIFLAVLIFSYTIGNTTDTYNSKIVCNNGEEYKAGEQSIDAKLALVEQQWQRNNPNGLQGNEPPSYLPKNFFTSTLSDKDKATSLCLGYPASLGADTIVNPGADVQLTVFIMDRIAQEQFKIELVNNMTWVFIAYLVFALLIVVVIFELIRRSFFYVVVGKKFWSKFL